MPFLAIDVEGDGGEERLGPIGTDGREDLPVRSAMLTGGQSDECLPLLLGGLFIDNGAPHAVAHATVRVPDLIESDVEPIKNPATGEEHRARIALPNGFEYKEAEMGNTVSCRVSAGDKLTFQLKNTYAQLNAFDWSN